MCCFGFFLHVSVFNIFTGQEVVNALSSTTENIKTKSTTSMSTVMKQKEAFVGFYINVDISSASPF